MDFDFAAREHLQVPTESHASRGNHTVLVYGAYGLTGRFVVTELIRRGLTPVLAGRSADGLAALAELHPDLHVRRAAADDPESLDLALVGVDAVINCAGPFLDTAMPVAEAALRSKVSYLDIAAEQPSTTSLFSDLDARAGDSGRDGAAGDGVLRRPGRSAGHADDGRLAGRGLDRDRDGPRGMAPDRWHPDDRDPQRRTAS
ncbi:MAG: saccharopine dehydrogenase NADP-binding domain-containing protein [Nocardioidaceae bacterium]